jgi:hypothetical protein
MLNTDRVNFFFSVFGVSKLCYSLSKLSGNDINSFICLRFEFQRVIVDLATIEKQFAFGRVLAPMCVFGTNLVFLTRCFQNFRNL